MHPKVRVEACPLPVLVDRPPLAMPVVLRRAVMPQAARLRVVMAVLLRRVAMLAHPLQAVMQAPLRLRERRCLIRRNPGR